MEIAKGSPIEVIRTTLREESRRERKSNRSDVLNRNRSALGQVSESISYYDLKEVVEIASKLKQKNQVSLMELKKLKQSFIVSQENIVAFLNVPGALHGLVRELSGHNSEFQFAALNCCCNLSLANEKLCHQLTKSSASYIASTLNELNTTYLDVCLWTLGNMAGSGMKSWTILKSHGVLNKYLHFIASPNSDVKQSAIYATTLYVKMGFDNLSSNEFRMIADHVYSELGRDSSVYWLIYLLSCSQAANEVFLLNMVTSCTFDLLVNLVNTNKAPKPSDVTALVRILANLCGEKSKQAISEIMLLLDIQSVDFLTAINGLLASPHEHLQRETLWFLGNLVKCCPEAGGFILSVGDRLKEALSKI
ncbi:Importin subunit alpha [Gryllus bimaculatus]|nr:Importin subunit alpha [Gryllus bimaculatus]